MKRMKVVIESTPINYFGEPANNRFPLFAIIPAPGRMGAAQRNPS
jgi:hypothetical protein